MLISIEGNDGTGKSTLSADLKNYFESLGKPCIVSKEPGTVFEGALRKILLEKNPCAKSELLLFLADRAEHVENHVKPWLKQGNVVILDRFIDSTLVYQSIVFKTMPMSQLYPLMTWTTGDLKPDKTLLLDASVSICNKRLSERNEVKRLGERAGEEQQERIRDAFLWLADREPKRISIIDSSTTRESSLAQALTALNMA